MGRGSCETCCPCWSYRPCGSLGTGLVPGDRGGALRASCASVLEHEYMRELLSSALVQHPWITPELSTGLGLDITAAVAALVPAARTSAANPAMTTLRPILIMYSLP